MNDPGMENLITSVLEGDTSASVSEARNLTDSGVVPEQIVIRGLSDAMSRLDAKCTLEEFNLLEIMMAGRAVMEVMKFLYPEGAAPAEVKGTVVIATLEGDIHDLGKNILRIVLIGKGYRAVDCGKDCSLQRLMEIAEKEHPMALGISGLITPVIPQVQQVRRELLVRGLKDVKIIAGGAALKQSSSGRLNVDFVAESAFEGVRYIERIAGMGI